MIIIKKGGWKPVLQSLNQMSNGEDLTDIEIGEKNKRRRVEARKLIRFKK